MRSDAAAGVEHSGPAFDAIKTFLIRTTGHARLSARDDLLMQKIRRRIEINALPSLDSYLALLRQGGSAEFDCLIAELTIGETSFFRHPEHFDALRDHVLPACLRRNSGTRQLRIWSAGCANGAESYSLAILVHSLLGEQLNEWHVAIIGSDINRAFLAEAESAVYSAWTVRDVPEEQRPAFFAKQSGQWAVRKHYRRNVQFVRHNLVSDELPCAAKSIASFDIILCRNVMIYLDDANNRRLAERLGMALVDEGWLLTAPTDLNAHLEQGFMLERVAGALIYRKPRRSVAAPAPRAARGGRLAIGKPRADVGGAGPGLSVRRARVAVRRREHQPAETVRRPHPSGLAAPDISGVMALADRGEWDAAARGCEAVLAADPCNALAHYVCALVQQYCGDADAAEQALKRALYLDRSFALAHYQLGLVRKNARDEESSRRSFRNALGALRRLPDDCPVSPCGQITAADLRGLAAQQLDLLASAAVQP